MEYIVDDGVNGVRLDTYLIDILSKSRSKIQNMIKCGNVRVNGSIQKSSYIVKLNDVIAVDEINEIESCELLAEDIKLDIVYEDDDVIVVNKSNGMVVHPAVGNKNGTLVNALLYHSKNLSGINEFRPGIVHRIDAYTTGLLMVAKNDEAHLELARQLESRSIHRKYIALVWGVIKNDTGTIDAPIGRDKMDRKKMAVTGENSKHAITNFKVLKRYDEVTLIELKLETGRTHQIRVHMNYIGYPIVNDPVYGRRKLIDESGQCLHASELGFIHPSTHEYMQFECETPECFNNILKKFE